MTTCPQSLSEYAQTITVRYEGIYQYHQIPITAAGHRQAEALVKDVHISNSTLFIEVCANNEDCDSNDVVDVDPHFFEPSYTLATATGFSVWEGSLFLLWFVQHQQATNPVAKELMETLLGGCPLTSTAPRVLELGSGTGVCGIGLAALGANVLCTDVKCVDDILSRNVRDAQLLMRSSSEYSIDRSLGVLLSVDSTAWKNSTRLGLSGCVASQVLDWTVPISQQRQNGVNDPTRASVILAVETAWLKSLVDPFARTVSSLLWWGLDHESAAVKCPPVAALEPRVCYWVYRERGTESSDIFTMLDDIVVQFKEYKCSVTVMDRVPSLEDPTKNMVVCKILPDNTFL